MATPKLRALREALVDLGSSRGLPRRVTDPIAKEVREVMYNRIKSGFGVASDRTTRSIGRRLDPLSESYKRQRRRTGVPGDRGTPNRSNLTYSGQMLDALTGRGLSGAIEIFIKDTRRRGGQTNKQVAGYASEDRPFLSFTKKEAKFVDSSVRRAILDRIRRAIR